MTAEDDTSVRASLLVVLPPLSVLRLAMVPGFMHLRSAAGLGAAANASGGV